MRGNVPVRLHGARDLSSLKNVLRAAGEIWRVNVWPNSLVPDLKVSRVEWVGTQADTIIRRGLSRKGPVTIIHRRGR